MSPKPSLLNRPDIQLGGPGRPDIPRETGDDLHGSAGRILHVQGYGIEARG
eukprot:CAMPEP_0198693526 /NCGR_PEP_ID=MMETSP1468-20131203/251945_1 /TAXON_ID=1461545 /ORGANISM="Mantoniella sp, Strain CCMP1436" /LENGTH=50 /DNA_ID=CAMNT_0044448227 /DNA_START=117 /DNA_END=269 /DNA_ORIENTATION=-